MRKRDFLISVAIPLFTGVFASLLTGGGMASFSTMATPPLTPPAWVFPLVWTVLYTMMGIAAYFVTITEQEGVDRALLWYGAQLTVNFFWSILFFGLQWYLAAFVWLVFLWWLILRTIRAFGKISKKAAWLLLPYWIWVTFAGYLNLGVWWMDRM